MSEDDLPLAGVPTRSDLDTLNFAELGYYLRRLDEYRQIVNEAYISKMPQGTKFIACMKFDDGIRHDPRCDGSCERRAEGKA